MSLTIPAVDTQDARQKQRDEKVAQMKSIVHDIRTLYNANTPLFTKDSIRKVGEELERCQRDASESRNITLKGINGIDCEITVSLPRVQDLPNKNQYFGGSTWVIAYHSFEWLTNERNTWFFHPKTAYLSLSIAACTREINLRPGDDALRASSTEELRDTFHEIERSWKASEYYERLQGALAAVKTPLVLDKVIGVALGPLILETLVNRDSITQHALISVIHSTLLQRGVLSASSKCYVQDPIYTQQDKDVLSSEDFTVLEDPGAFLTMDDSSVHVSISPDIPVKQIVADICRPGIIIWSKKHDSIYLTTDPDSPRVDRMIEKDYYELDFPFHESFGDLVMYIRKVS
ncbi:hypothetical protein F5Y09DRAFT_319038 [Xylaria sp. FL1042]|nr:hypothetical protein F5Y09DRAFT_319038 [Xylaria sp. FL1042]